MNDDQSTSELSNWFSTYGLITVEPLLERYKIRLDHEDLLNALKTPNTFYHQLLRLPLRNVRNGIIFQQAHDYQVYAQKLFVDYLLSGQSGKAEGSPGSASRQDLEETRLELIDLGERFHEQELNQDKLIAESQAMLIKHASDWKQALQEVASELNESLNQRGFIQTKAQIEQALITLLAHYGFHNEIQTSDGGYWSMIESKLGISITKDIRQIFVEKLSELNDFNKETDESTLEFNRQITEMSTKLKDFRSEFYRLIIKASDLIQQLPDYHVDMAQIEVNRQDLYFDPDIGS